MTDVAHRIGRIRLNLRASDQAAYEEVARVFTARFDSEVLPAMQAAFDAFDDTGQVIVLDRLELDLGRLDPSDPRIGEMVGHAFTLALGRNRQTRGVAASLDSRTDPQEALIAFLKTGLLPWPDPGAALAGLIAMVGAWDRIRLAAFGRLLLPALLRPETARRFLLQLPRPLIGRIIFVLAGWPDTAIVAMPPTSHLSNDEAQAILPLVLALARSGGASDTAAAVAVALIAPQPVDRAARDTLPPVAETEMPTDANLRYPVAAAGAVLLHPYLHRYFDALGLLDNGRFRDRGAQERAVLLGQFLATGDENSAEPDCVLMKLLCGLPLTAPLPRDAGIGAAEREEAETLLTAVVHHWGRLGATTPEGLRDGFLRRPGILRILESGPVLTVERRTVDILLDRLPWTISRIRTPFMHSVLVVQWV